MTLERWGLSLEFEGPLAIPKGRIGHLRGIGEALHYRRVSEGIRGRGESVHLVAPPIISADLEHGVIRSDLDPLHVHGGHDRLKLRLSDALASPAKAYDTQQAYAQFLVHSAA
jgi:hypothetical protein